MFDQYDSNYDQPRFSKGVDLLIARARAGFFNWRSTYVQGLDRSWEVFLKEEGAKEDLYRGLAALELEVHKALSVLAGSLTLSLEPEMGETVGSFLAILDQAVFLSEFLTDGRCPDLDDEFTREAVAIADMALVDRPVRYHRLIPINVWRRNLRDRLPAQGVHLLPWYDWYADVDDLLIIDLVENLEAIEDEDFQMFGDQAPFIGSLFEEIKEDREFLFELRGRSWTDKALMHVLGNSRAYGLFYLIIRTLDLVPPMDEKVMNLGFQGVAVQALSDDVATEAERIERIYMAAFCGPDLDDDARLELFNKVEEGLSYLADSPVNSLGYYLRQWDQRIIDGVALAKETFITWDKALSIAAKKIEAAKKIDQPIPYREGWFAETVEWLKKTPLIPRPMETKPGLLDHLIPKPKRGVDEQLHTIAAAVNGFLAGIRDADIRNILARPALVLAEESMEEPESKEIDIPYPNPLLLEMPEDMVLGPEIEKFMDISSEYDLWYGGFVLNKSGAVRQIAIHRMGAPFRRSECAPPDCQLLVLAVSGDRSALKRALNLVSSLLSTSTDQPPPVTPNIFWICYYVRD